MIKSMSLLRMVALVGGFAAVLACSSSSGGTDKTDGSASSGADTSADQGGGGASGDAATAGATGKDAAAGAGGGSGGMGVDAAAGGAAGSAADARVDGTSGASDGGSVAKDGGCEGNCNEAPCNRDYMITSNAEFAAFVALQCRALTGSLRITQTEMTSLTGLLVESVGEDLIIAANPQLTSLQGLENIKHVGRSLSIVNNAKLASLAPLQTWPAGAVVTSIAVFNNPALPQCEVDKLDARLTANCTNCANNGTGTCM